MDSVSTSLCWLQPTVHNEIKRLDPQHIDGLINTGVIN